MNSETPIRKNSNANTNNKVIETLYDLRTPGGIFSTTTSSKSYFVRMIRNAKKYGWEFEPCSYRKSIWTDLIYDYNDNGEEFVCYARFTVSLVYHGSR